MYCDEILQLTVVFNSLSRCLSDVLCSVDDVVEPFSYYISRFVLIGVTNALVVVTVSRAPSTPNPALFSMAVSWTAFGLNFPCSSHHRRHRGSSLSFSNIRKELHHLVHCGKGRRFFSLNRASHVRAECSYLTFTCCMASDGVPRSPPPVLSTSLITRMLWSWFDRNASHD